MEGNQEPPPPQPAQQSLPQSTTGNPPPAPDAAQYHHLQQQQQQQLQMFWSYKRQEIKNANDFKNPQIPLARIKKIMKADQDVRMISREAPILFVKACELFILELTFRSWLHAEANNRLTLQKNDITATIARTEIFDFLVDVIPRDEEIKDEAAGLGIMPPTPTGIVGPPTGVGPTAPGDDVVPRDEEIKDEAAGLGIMPPTPTGIVPSTGIVGPPTGVGPTAPGDDVVPRDEEIKDEAAGLGMMPPTGIVPSTGIVGPPSDDVGPTASAPNSGDDGSNGSAPNSGGNSAQGNLDAHRILKEFKSWLTLVRDKAVIEDLEH